ncbi:MMPL family transporter [Thermomonospora sp. CIF 1]|uniref:MMPL family transporter n=1 Tax=Thermomonospora sp. CIF 1 TaxID=1916083 RepID=UPI000ABB3768|nr:MMPL family transporter [Thermomonospora sp. CIF 1]PKK14725.1 MAG: hypothetical protein BUE48_008820 [Thermomonospora sp. CIF 1]
MQGLPRAVRRLPPVLIVLAWLAVGGALGPYAGKLSQVSTNDQAAFLPQSAESTRALEEQKKFQQTETFPAIVVWTADRGRATEAQRKQAVAALTSLNGTPGVVGEAGDGSVLTSSDGRALAGVVQLEPGLGDELPPTVERITRAAERVEGMTARVGGPAAIQAGFAEAFAGIDGVLLGVAVGAVLLILLLVYRSLLLPFVIILGAVSALALAGAIAYALADRDVVRVDGQVQGILFILVIGAATDYALLLSARFREELADRTAHRDRVAAAAAALRRSWAPIVASAATVALGLLALLLSDLTNNRALGPVGAIGIGCALLSALTFLPGALALLGRAAYWPSKPKPGGRNAFWRKVAAVVDRAPRRVWLGTALLLAALAAFAPTLVVRSTPLTETFVDDTSAVAAQRALAEHFPAGFGNPAVVIADADRADAVIAAAQRTPGIAAVTPLTRPGPPGPSGTGEPLVVDGRVRIDVTLRDEADSAAAERTVRLLRQRLHAVPGADALVGGYTAQRYDTQVTADRDRRVIIPVVLAIVTVILIALLRSLPIPLLLVATVVLNFLATLGVAALVFAHLLGLDGTEPALVLYGFVFLVALGVDYNIFLMSRVREETAAHGTRQGVRRGLTTTGGVITSAGVVLAATFTALVVIPLTFMAQIAFIVAFGVLLDTLVVRSLLVPALVGDLGRRAWWPSRLWRRADRSPPGAHLAGAQLAGSKPVAHHAKPHRGLLRATGAHAKVHGGDAHEVGRHRRR